MGPNCIALTTWVPLPTQSWPLSALIIVWPPNFDLSILPPCQYRLSIRLPGCAGRNPVDMQQQQQAAGYLPSGAGPPSATGSV